MSEQSYPISCQSCGKQLYGPVSYCPYCAVMCAVAPVKEAAVESPTIAQVTENTIVTPSHESVSVQQPHPVQDETPLETPPEETRNVAPEVKTPEQKSEPVPEKKTEKPQAETIQQVIPSPKPSDNLKWIAIAVVLVVGIAGYLIWQKRGAASQDSSGSQQSSTPAAQGQGKKDSARIAAQDALRKGTDLSLTISKLPKLEKVLKAAKQLGDISPRYQEQIASAESTVSAARSDLNQGVLAYIGKVAELGRYTPDQISYAMGVIQKGDLAPREKIVAELLQKQVNSSSNSSKSDSKKILSDFTKSFTDFID